jgi:hypothetical protein
MKKLIPLLVIFLYLWGCGGGEERGPAVSTEGEPAGVTVEYTAPEPMAVPEYKMPQSDTDWEAKVNNKDIEVIQVLNIINPIAAYITAGFDQYGDRIDNPTVHEEWKDTGEQLTKALNLYESCKERKKEANFDKKLFLDMEDTWQLLVKTGVAGVRTKSMLDAELKKL